MTQFAPVDFPAKSEIKAMAGVLTRRYGPRASEIARHFLGAHQIIGDSARAALWGEVCAELEHGLAPQTLS